MMRCQQKVFEPVAVYYQTPLVPGNQVLVCERV